MSSGRLDNGVGKAKMKLFKDIVFATNTCIRSGIIPYFFQEGEIYFVLGLDAKFPTLSDFAGRKKNNEEIWQAAIREFCEEIHRIVRPPSFNCLQDKIVVYNNVNMTIFYPINVTDPQKLYSDFSNRITRRSEMKSLRILNEMEMKTAMINNHPHIFLVLRALLLYYIDEIIVELYKQEANNKI